MSAHLSSKEIFIADATNTSAHTVRRVLKFWYNTGISSDCIFVIMMQYNPPFYSVIACIVMMIFDLSTICCLQLPIYPVWFVFFDCGGTWSIFLKAIYCYGFSCQ